MMKFTWIYAIVLGAFLASCSFSADTSSEDKQDVYQVSKFSQAPQIDAVWNKKPWADVNPLQLARFMGSRPEHFPFVQAKLGYDDDAIYVIFKVDDQYVKAVHANHQDPVYKDSCVEFFFAPEADVDSGYFNLEMNCGGTMLFHHQRQRATDVIHISDQDVEQVTVAHSLPKLVDPEIQKKTTWVVEYRIPFSMLRKYRNFHNPNSGETWRANLYKCADDTSHPHWLTWANVDFPRPNFHLPEYFGTLEFQ
jgi:hypothetical protein